LRKDCGIAQLVSSELGEDEPVVPLASSLLQCFKARGDAVGLRERLRSGLGEIARKLGALANLVQLGCILRDRIRQTGFAAILETFVR